MHNQECLGERKTVLRSNAGRSCEAVLAHAARYAGIHAPSTGLVLRCKSPESIRIYWLAVRKKQICGASGASAGIQLVLSPQQLYAD
jgi:hypothetical protein